MAPGETEPTGAVVNTCQENSDCKLGSCDPAAGRCAVNDSNLRAVLLEILPPSSDDRFGGRRFYQYIDPTDKDVPEVLQLPRPPAVQGRVVLTGDNNTDENLCGSGRKLTLTFLPVERHLGIDVLTYRVTSDYAYDELTGVFEHNFRFDGLPEGSYDISWEFAHKTLVPPTRECAVVPRLQRGVRIERINGKVPSLDLASPETQDVKVLLPWDEAFENWRVDLVHPTTSEALSTAGSFTEQQLETATDGTELAVVNLRVGSVVGSDYVEPDQQQLRLQPPAGVARPTILLFREGLEVFAKGELRVPALHPFDTLVNYQSWVWKENIPEAPVAGVVRFDAVTLADLPLGQAMFSMRVDISEDGKVEALLPPGRYSLRVLPEGSALSTYTTSREIWPPPASSPQGSSQSGHVVAVPTTKKLSGKVVLPTSNGSTDIVVEALGVPPIGVATTQSQNSTARGVSTLVKSERGNFTLAGADCGDCKDGSGAKFDIRVRPSPSSGFPWLVRANVEVFEDLDLGNLEVDAPYVYERKLEFPAPEDSDGSFPNALIRAYALLDESGVPILKGIPETCEAQLRQAPEARRGRCLARAVQIAETRSGAEGRFRLLLPTNLNDAAE